MPQHDVPFLEALDALIALQEEGKIWHLALSSRPHLEQNVAARSTVAAISAARE